MKTTRLPLLSVQYEALRRKNGFRLLPLVLLLLMVSCAKKEAITPSGPVDPRDQYVGTYTCTGSSVETDKLGFTTNRSFAATLTFVKGGGSTELAYTDLNGTHTCKLAGSSFTVADYTVKDAAGYLYTVTDSGSFSENTLTFSSYLRGNGAQRKALYRGTRH